jgi:hypothetical protein
MTMCRKIKEVKQGRESADDYVIWFEEFEGFTGFDDTALTKIFKEGLSPQILSCCYSLENILVTLTTWKEKARLFHQQYLELQQQQHHRAGQPQQQQQSGSRHQPQPGSSCQGACQLQVSGSFTPLLQIKKETWDGELGWIHHGKCYCCGKEGHWATNCQQKCPSAQHGGKLTHGCHGHCWHEEQFLFSFVLRRSRTLDSM